MQKKTAKTPNLLTWSQEYSVGNQNIDDDHKYMITVINNIHLSEKSLDRGQIELLLSELISYAVRHFHHEESYMSRTGYPDIARHKELHDEFMVRIQHFHQDFQKQGGRLDAGDISRFLAAWWKDHILHEDQLYADAAAQRRLR